MLAMYQMSGSMSWEKPFMTGGLPRTNQRMRNASIRKVIYKPLLEKNTGIKRISAFPLCSNSTLNVDGLYQEFYTCYNNAAKLSKGSDARL